MAANPFKFFQEVRQETNKVTWPSRRETAITTAMVFVFSALAAVFFLVADQIIRVMVTSVLNVGNQEDQWYWLGAFILFIVIAAAFSGRERIKEWIIIIIRR